MRPLQAVGLGALLAYVLVVLAGAVLARAASLPLGRAILALGTGALLGWVLIQAVNALQVNMRARRAARDTVERLERIDRLMAGAQASVADGLGLTGPIDEYGLYATRQLRDGRWLCVQPLTHGGAELAVTLAAGASIAEAFAAFESYADIWHYNSRAAAIAAMVAWDGHTEPTGWTRHPRSGRRRRPDGVIVHDA
jgi:hypothetical protein